MSRHAPTPRAWRSSTNRSLCSDTTVDTVAYPLTTAATDDRPRSQHIAIRYDTIRYDTRGYFNERSGDDIGQLNLPHGTELKSGKEKN